MSKLNYAIFEDGENSQIPSKREGFAFILVPELNSLLLFGGQTEDSTYSSEIYLYNLYTNVWTTQETTGEKPQPLSYSAHWYDPPHMFLHGGRNKDKSLNETFMLDLETFIWRKIFTMEQPSSRYGHCAVRNDDKQAYIFGGCNIGKKDQRFLNDISKLEYKSITVVEGDSGNVNGASWITNIVTKGDKPTGRKGHSMIYLNNCNSIIVYGGETKQGINDSVIYNFSIDEKEWSKIELKGDSISPRAYSAMKLLNGSSAAIIYGGKCNDGSISNDIFFIDINEGSICKQPVDDKIINNRFCSSCCELIDENNNYHLLSLGGKDSDNSYCKMSIIDIIYFINEINISDINNYNNENIIEDNNENVYEDSNENNNEINNKNDENDNINYMNKMINNDNFTQDQPLLNDTISNKTKNNNGSKKSNSNNSNLPPTNKNGIPISSRSNSNNTEIKLKKERLINELSSLEKTFLEKYNIYDNCQKKLKQLKLENSKIENLKFEKKIYILDQQRRIEKLNQELNELNKEKESLAKAIQIKDQLTNLEKKRFCCVSDFFFSYIPDIIKMDEFINQTIEKNIIFPNVDYEALNEKRKLYIKKLNDMLSSSKENNKYENDIVNQIKQKFIQNQDKKLINTFIFEDQGLKDSLEMNNS